MTRYLRLFTLTALALTITLMSVGPAWALDLGQAKAQGLVGEAPTGYLGAVKPTPEVSALVSEINAKRKVKYQEIAKKNGTQLEAVEALAGKKAIDNTLSGQYVMAANGQWVKK